MTYVGQHVRLSASGGGATDLRRLIGIRGVVVTVSGRIRQDVEVLFDGDQKPTRLQAMFIEPDF
jgi:hypothetical protein